MLLLKTIALLALALVIVLIAWPRDSSLSVEEINRRTLKAAAAIAEGRCRWLLRKRRALARAA
jgi:hypothetical protein